MESNSWLIILSVGVFILVLGIVVAIGFLVYAIMEIRRLAMTVNEFVKTTEERLTPVLLETELSLRSVRKITDDVGVVTDNVRDLSDAMKEVSLNVRALSTVVGNVGEGVSLRAAGVKAGVRTALGVLINQIRERRSDYER
ncbi:MAG: DUF948 domain-containing protein [Nitrospirota bacterium]